MYAYLISGDTAIKTYCGSNPPDGWYQSETSIDWTKYYWDGIGPALKPPLPDPKPYEMPLADYKQMYINQVNAECGQILLSGFYCDALGEMHKYDTDIVDQINFAQAMNMAELTGSEIYRMWNTDDKTKSWYPHTYDQFQSVLQAGADWKRQKLYKCSAYKDAIAAATDKAAVDAIVAGIDWEAEI